MKMFILLLLLITDLASSTNPKCPKLEISLTQKIENEGFHRELRWLLERNIEPQCKLLIKLQVNKEMYLNPDQIDDLNRLGHISVYIDGKVDVEAVSHEATPHVAYIFAPNTTKTTINLPFHLRYQRSRISGGSGKITVNKPTILGICEDCGMGKIQAPCDVQNEKKCFWKNIPYEALFDEAELLVPVGDLDDYPLVSIVTLLLGCAGCIYILSVLSTAPI